MSLYKYRAVGDLASGNLDPHLVTLLSKGEIYFSNPKEFNDPFDCLFSFHKNVTNNEIIKHLRSILVPEWEIQYLLTNNGLAKLKDKVIEKNENADLLRIFSLANNCLNTLLWSHYSQNHYGICIGFKTYSYNNVEHLYITRNQIDVNLPEYPKNLVPAVKVNYSSERPEAFSIILKESDDLKKVFLTKDICWEYEEERRIIIASKYLKRNPIHINRSQIEEIIFGLRTPKTFEDKIINIVSDIKGIKIYKVKINNGTFKLIKQKYTA